jgi:hypothetical protein
MGKRGLMVAPTFDLVLDPMLDTFLSVCDKSGVRYQHNQQKHKIELIDFDVIISYASADRPRGLEGKNVSFGWIDEAQDCQRQAYLNATARFRVPAPRRQFIVTGTPKANSWLRQEFDSGKKGRELIRATTFDNAYNDSDYVYEQLETLSEAEARAYVYGEWLNVDGQVYEEFDREHHTHSRSIITGVEQVRGMLRNARGRTTLWFSNQTVPGLPESSSLVGCKSERGLLNAFENYVWRKDIQKPSKGEPAQQSDHVLDALRYMLRHSVRGRPAGVWRRA